MRAALHWIRGETKEYEALEKEVLAYDPTHGEFYLICAELVGERQRRYDTAEMFARKAIATDPANRSAYVVLGESLMNTGQTDEALKQFQVGVEKAKRYGDVRRDNWIEVLSRWMPKFKVIETENFRIRMPHQTSGTRHAALPARICSRSRYETLTKKYGLEQVKHPTHADSFDNATRTSPYAAWGRPACPPSAFVSAT